MVSKDEVAVAMDTVVTDKNSAQSNLSLKE